MNKKTTTIAQNNNLANKIILITGATDGIGKQVAIQCAQQRAQTILLGKDIKKLNQVYQEIEQLNGKPPLLMPINFAGAEIEHYDQIMLAIKQQFSRLDSLIHIAGIAGDKSPTINHNCLDWFNILQVNLNSVFLLTKSLLPLMQSVDAIDTTAKIIFTLAAEGREARAYQGAYGISKAALQHFMLQLAEELSNLNISVCGVVPAETYTKLRLKSYPGITSEDTMSAAKMATKYLTTLQYDCAQIHGKIIDFTVDNKQII